MSKIATHAMFKEALEDRRELRGKLDQLTPDPKKIRDKKRLQQKRQALEDAGKLAYEWER